MTALILGILDSQAKLAVALISSQTPGEQAIMWQRYIDLTTPLHNLLCKLEHITPGETAAAIAVTHPTTAEPAKA